jgi:dipeptidyl-peptidase-4
VKGSLSRERPSRLHARLASIIRRFVVGSFLVIRICPLFWFLSESLFFIGISSLFLTDASLVSADEPSEVQAAETTELTLEQIFGGHFDARGFDLTWDETGDFGWRWEDAKEGGGRDLVRVDVVADERQVIVTAAELTPPGESRPLSIEDWHWSPQRDKLLLFTNSQRVWRHNTRGDYWVYDRTSRVLHQLGGGAPTGSLMFAKFSPDGNSVAYVRDGNVVMESLLDHSVRSIPHSGSPQLIQGTFDWVYEEELMARDGFRWSPRGDAIAFWQLDTTGVPVFTMINNTDTFYPKTIEFAYPKTGQRNSACRIAVMDVATEQMAWMQIPGDPREHYLARMEWDGDHHLVVQQLNRQQNQLRIWRCDARTGSATLVLEERDNAWIDVHDEMFWLKDRQQFTWVTERDGWRSVYLVSRDGDVQRRVTGNYDVIELLGVDERHEQLYFLASPNAATECYLHRVNLDGSGETRVTPENQKGSHRYQLSPKRDYAIHHRSRFGKPPRIELVDLPSHEVVRALEENQELQEKLDGLDQGRTEMMSVEIEPGVSLDGWVIYPQGFQEDGSYPLVVHVYGEPAGQTVTDRWHGSGYLWHQFLAQHGYCVVSFDSRGTPAPKGRAWRKSVYRKVGIVSPADQAAAVRQLLEERPYLDATRVGVWGWSGGGSMTLNALFKYPDLYHVGISIAPVPNQRHYDTIYQERYMGLPSDNVDGYLEGSPIHFASRLQGRLLLIHGTGDDNCHYQSTEALMNELVRHQKQFQMMAYPNRTHGIGEGAGTTLHLRQLMWDFLRTHLPPGETSPSAPTNRE